MQDLIIINKPKGITSFGVIRELRRKLGVKKIGHGGTLDPNATGVLIVGVGKGTKKLNDVIGLDKEYEAEIIFGAISNTYDVEGEIKKIEGHLPSLKDIKEVLPKFIGEIMQVPPIFSAKKIQGKPAYKRARKGDEFTIEPAKVFVKNIEVISYEKPILKLKVECGKGFYVRSLAHDLGEALGCGAYLSNLTRTKVGDFTIKDAKIFLIRSIQE